MDVLGMYLLQRVSDSITIQRNGAFEKRFYSPIPNNQVAKLENDGYISTSKDISSVVYEGDY